MNQTIRTTKEVFTYYYCLEESSTPSMDDIMLLLYKAGILEISCYHMDIVEPYHVTEAIYHFFKEGFKRDFFSYYVRDVSCCFPYVPEATLLRKYSCRGDF